MKVFVASDSLRLHTLLALPRPVVIPLARSLMIPCYFVLLLFGITLRSRLVQRFLAARRNKQSSRVHDLLEHFVLSDLRTASTLC